ncbi:MAG: DNA-processing protein DprA [Saprospiraceae bacterium]
MNTNDQPQLPDEKELLFQIALTMIPNVGSVTARTLLSYCGSPAEVFSSSQKQLLQIPGIGPAIVSQLSKPSVLADAEKELSFIREHQISPLFFTDPGYPRRLRQLPDAPVMLYSRGNASLNTARIVAIIGTRSPTDYGRTMTDRLVEDLAPYGIHIVSGLAYGIDIRAHRACLRHQVPTTGVLGSGFRNIYPGTHASVAHKMMDRGSLLTEFHSYTKPTRENFPMRNRIIAGLADAVIVIETAARGGSIITAELANGYHKDVFAIPGHVTSERSSGCHKLIRTHKAALIECGADVAYFMGWDQALSVKNTQQQLPLDLPENESQLLEMLSKHPASSLDYLAYHLHTTPGNLSSTLLQLEIKGLIRSMPGNRYLAADASGIPYTNKE